MGERCCGNGETGVGEEEEIKKPERAQNGAVAVYVEPERHSDWRYGCVWRADGTMAVTRAREIPVFTTVCLVLLFMSQCPKWL